MACKSVFVVDDERDVRETLKEALELEGYVVHVASNGKEAIEKLKSIKERPCLILLDLMMPVMNGWDFLKARGKDDMLAQIPVAVVSAAGRPVDVVEGATTMRKPLDLFALIELVTSFCPHREELTGPANNSRGKKAA